MTKQHFQAMADIVKAIRDGKWTDDSPSWANPRLTGSPIPCYWRAVQTAEAFILIAERFNPLFNRDRFLVACGLVAAPVKVRKVRTPTLGACSCKRGIERDNCPACEGTGKRIDFAAIRARSAE